MRYLNCKVCTQVSDYNAPKEGLKYAHVNCMGCKSEFICCMDCDFQADLQNGTFVRFGCNPASYMRQHFKLTHSHMLNDKEIPKKTVEKVNDNT